MIPNVDDTIKKIVEEGDTLAYGHLVDQFAGPAFGVAFAIVGNREDARDIAQDAFVMAYEMLPALRDRSRFASWLKRIAASLSKNSLRDNRRRMAAHAAHAAEIVEEPRARIEVHERDDVVYNNIQALPERHRTVIIMKYLEGMRYNDIASFLEMSVRSVKTLAFEAKHLLLVRLKRHGLHAPHLPQIQ